MIQKDLLHPPTFPVLTYLPLVKWNFLGHGLPLSGVLLWKEYFISHANFTVSGNLLPYRKRAWAQASIFCNHQALRYHHFLMAFENTFAIRHFRNMKETWPSELSQGFLGSTLVSFVWVICVFLIAYLTTRSDSFMFSPVAVWVKI